MRIHISYRKFEFCPRATTFSFITAHLGWLLGVLTFPIGICLLAAFSSGDILQSILSLIGYVILLHIVFVVFPACADTYTDLIFLKHKSGDEKTPKYKALRKARLLNLGEFLKKSAVKFYSTAVCVIIGIGGLLLIFDKGIGKEIPFPPTVVTILGIFMVVLAIVLMILLRSLYKRLFNENKQDRQ